MLWNPPIELLKDWVPLNGVLCCAVFQKITLCINEWEGAPLETVLYFWLLSCAKVISETTLASLQKQSKRDFTQSNLPLPPVHFKFQKSIYLCFDEESCVSG